MKNKYDNLPRLNEVPDYRNKKLNEIPNLDKYKLENDDLADLDFNIEIRVNGIVQNKQPENFIKKSGNLNEVYKNKVDLKTNLNEVIHHEQDNKLNEVYKNDFDMKDNLNEVMQYDQTNNLNEIYDPFKDLDIVPVELFEKVNTEMLMKLGSQFK